MAKRLYVQYGCGLSAPADWLNFDSSPRLRFERLPGVAVIAAALGRRLFPPNVRFGNIVQGLPLPERSAEGIYASHVLEHLSREDIGVALANTFRLLKPGGVFRMIVPDLAWRAERYILERNCGRSDAADNFIASCNMRDTRRARGTMAHLRIMLGNTGHLWMYDRQLITRLLTEAGFVDIRVARIGDSGDPMFDLVEDPHRFTDCGHDEAALQARRPV